MNSSHFAPYVLALLLALPNLASAEPRPSDRGTYAIRCTPSASSQFSGIYSLDYLATLSDVDGARYLSVTKAETARDHILAQLRAKKMGVLALYLKDVFTSSANHLDYRQPRIWLDSPHQLVELNDEDLIRRLPPNCRELRGAAPQKIQVGILEQRNGLWVHEYDANLLAEITSPLQLSMTWFSLALRELVQDPRMLRRINRLLHTNQLDALDGDSLPHTLKQMGLEEPPNYFHSACYRSKAMQHQLLILTKSSHCSEVNSHPVRHEVVSLGRGKSLEQNLDEFEPDDFVDIGALEAEAEAGIGLDKLAAAKNVPRRLIRRLTITDASTQAFPGAAFPGLTSLTYLFFQGRTLDNSLLPRRGTLFYFAVKNGKLRVLRNVDFKRVFNEDASVRGGNLTLDFSGCPLVHIAEGVLPAIHPRLERQLELHLGGNAFSGDERSRVEAMASIANWKVRY